MGCVSTASVSVMAVSAATLSDSTVPAVSLTAALSSAGACAAFCPHAPTPATTNIIAIVKSFFICLPPDFINDKTCTPSAV